MAWRIEFFALGQKIIARLDPQARQHVLKFLHERIVGLNDPRGFGEALKIPGSTTFGSAASATTMFQDAALCVLVVKIENRREIYR